MSVVRLVVAVQTDGVCSPCVSLCEGGGISPCCPGRVGGGSRCWRGFLQLSTTGASWGSAALIALSFCAAEGHRCSFLFVFSVQIFFRFYNQTPQESVRVCCSWYYLLFFWKEITNQHDIFLPSVMNLPFLLPLLLSYSSYFYFLFSLIIVVIIIWMDGWRNIITYILCIVL